MNNNEDNNINQNVVPNTQPTPINPLENFSQIPTQHSIPNVQPSNIPTSIETIQPTTNVQNVTQQSIPNVQPNNIPTSVETIQPTTNVQNVTQQSIPNVQPNNIPTSVETIQPTTNMQNVTQQSIPNVQPNNIPTSVETIQPTTNMQNTTTNETIQSSVVEEITTKEDMSDVADITFDYNQIYDNQNNNQDTEEELDVVKKPMFTEQELEIKVNDLQNRTTNDVVPEFNINALNENVNKEDSKLTDTILNDKQQDKQNTRRAVIWIAILVLILVIFVGFIFPIINGYKF